MAMQYTPVNTDVLPTFVLLHLAFPGLLWLLTRNAWLALAASLLLSMAPGVRLDLYRRGRAENGTSIRWRGRSVRVRRLVCVQGRGRLRTIVQSRTMLVLAILYLAFSRHRDIELANQATRRIYARDPVEGDLSDRQKQPSAGAPAAFPFALAIVVSRLMPSDWQA
jgi:hypothetical protein